RFGLPDKKGALVGTVFQASPAEKAGLQRGDVIVEFAGQALEDANQLTRAASKTPPGKSVEVVVMRGGGRKTLRVEIGERPEWAERGQAPSSGPGRRREPSAAKDAAQWEGVSVTESRFGVIVVQVARDSKLYGHLEDGDVIQGVNQQKIDSVADFKKATREANLKDGVVFDLIRGGQEMYISVQE
ncbi:MAG: PDZ domain-containing protein, partial [Elusimicrobia bacterium]|nr:PDZ domain-containing protein [Elusimicrobiota bacterium]